MLTQTLTVISVLLTIGLAAVGAFVVLIRGGLAGLKETTEMQEGRIKVLERELAATKAERDAALAGKAAVEAERDALGRIKTNDEKVDRLATRLDEAIAELARHNAEARKHWRHEDEVGDSMVRLLADSLNRRGE